MFISYIYNRGNNQIENLRQNENNRSNIRKAVIHTEEECKHNLMIIASAPLLA